MLQLILVVVATVSVTHSADHHLVSVDWLVVVWCIYIHCTPSKQCAQLLISSLAINMQQH